MFPTALIDVFRTQSAHINNDIVEHFGAATVELSALQTNAVVSPLGNLIRIRATGNDRAKFLHSFCTNDIKGLAAGTACEAIFTDVKARIIAHGYILASQTSHEIWMLPGDREALLNHLNRYIITEDVVIEAVESDVTTFVVAGPAAAAVLNASEITLGTNDGKNWCGLSDNCATLFVNWNDLPTAFVSVPSVSAVAVWKRLLESGATAAGDFVFQHLRILEGFPIYGRDITSENLAPESGRNVKTISYRKGCYLGQEPIARIDAMGHVNRQLLRCEASDCVTDSPQESLPEVTSISPLETQPWPAMTMLKVKSASAGEQLLARTSDGRCVSLQVKPAGN